MRIESKKLIIETKNGNIEALLDKPNEINNELSDYIAVCCHPHSLHGGTLTNKVVYTLSRTFAGRAIPSIRFNFRGVGNSEGEYDDGLGEQDDLRNVVNWMQERYPNKQLILGGFSFGAFVSIMASNQLNPQILISIAPPIGRFDFTAMKTPRCPWTVIQGDEDELVNCSDVEEWVTQQPSDLSFVKLVGASHFFHGKLVELKSKIESIIS
ncbi:MAG: alpha/beta hydrolase [Kangiella sp.]|nr:MAG: alpha/beta hydrolase [Kangiella sp.]